MPRAIYGPPSLKMQFAQLNVIIKLIEQLLEAFQLNAHSSFRQLQLVQEDIRMMDTNLQRAIRERPQLPPPLPQSKLWPNQLQQDSKSMHSVKSSLSLSRRPTVQRIPSDKRVHTIRDAREQRDLVLSLENPVQQMHPAHRPSTERPGTPFPYDEPEPLQPKSPRLRLRFNPQGQRGQAL